MWFWLGSVPHMLLPMHGPRHRHQHEHVLISHTRSATLPAHTTYLQITCSDFKRKEGSNHVYERGEANGEPMTMSTLLWTRSPVDFSAARPGTRAKGE